MKTRAKAVKGVDTKDYISGGFVVNFHVQKSK